LLCNFTGNNTILQAATGYSPTEKFYLQTLEISANKSLYIDNKFLGIWQILFFVSF
jgi:hypothetical protein